ncbi:MAG: biotin--[acetyl-CoA-carboxylase] ligase, partial [Gemmatimonadales bacterium]
PRRAAPGGGVVGVRVGLAVAGALERLGVRVLLKWPNDVMLEDRKVAGILCEARWAGGALRWIAVGVGINVHGPMPEELAGDAVALSEVSDEITRVAVLEQLVPQLNGMADCETLSDEECVAYGARDWLRGRELLEPVAGLVQGVAADGTLLVEAHNGVHRVSGGGVVVA